MLYDYFLARQTGGQLIMRVEDTDQERLVPGALEQLLKTFVTLDIDYDEGPMLLPDGSIGEKGSCGPYIQSQRLAIYRPYVDQLLTAGQAYPCFCSPETLRVMREEQIALKQAPRYDRRCLRLSSDDVQVRLQHGEPHVVRLKIPEGTCSFVDGIRGEIVFQNNEVDDQILLKSDGFPTYHLAVVVDDHLMHITHVLRGEEWISSTPKQIILHQLLGWEMPVYAHVPLILNPDKTKLSKRKGDVSVDTFLEKGYLPEALINFLALLGWNPTSDREIFSRQELIELFDLSCVNRSGAVLNVEKLDWTNAQYIKQMDKITYLEHCRLVTATMSLEVVDDAMIERVCCMVKDRVQRFQEIPGLVTFIFQDTLVYDPQLLHWKIQSTEEVRERLMACRDWITEVSEEVFSSVEGLDRALRTWIALRGWGNGDTLWPLRVALSGAKQSPSPFELLYVYGRERALQRIDAALGKIG